MKTEIAIFNYIDAIELPTEVVDMCYHQGECIYDIEHCMDMPEVKSELAKIDKQKLIQELYECGAWTEKELQDHEENLKRILWLASGDIQENRDQ